jgi:hypothetical protein
MRRLKTCVENWPECESGMYDPRCCRFPKSCSCMSYDLELVEESELEPVVAHVEPMTAIDHGTGTSVAFACPWCGRPMRLWRGRCGGWRDERMCVRAMHEETRSEACETTSEGPSPSDGDNPMQTFGHGRGDG